jgi:hypothetical protein
MLRRKRTVSRMKSAASTALVCILFYGCLSGQTVTDSQRLPNVTDKVLTGEFVGMEEIKDYEPGKKWFHENSLLSKDNEAVLDKVPVEIVKGRKQYSASDGGFITYRARFSRRNGKLFVTLRPFDSDYIIFPTGGCEPYSKVTNFPVEMGPRGIEIDGVLYHATKFSKEKREQLSNRLQNEPMEYTGTRRYSIEHKRPPCQ